MKADTARRAGRPPEYQLKHRVTGAALMAAAAALAVALLLGGPGGGGDAGDAQTIRFDFGDAPAADSTVAVENADTEAAVTALPETVPINSDDTVTPATPPTVALDQPGWAVRVGAFSVAANRDAVTAALESAGFEVNQTRVTTAQGKAATSLWLGPYAARQTARQAQAQAARVSADAEVVKYAP